MKKRQADKSKKALRRIKTRERKALKKLRERKVRMKNFKVKPFYYYYYN